MSSDEQTRDISNLGVDFFSFQRKINFKTVMDLKNSTTEQLLSLLKRRNVPQEALDLLRDNGIDGSTLLQPIDDIDEFMAVVRKSGHRLLIKRIIKEELARADLHVEAQVSVQKQLSKYFGNQRRNSKPNKSSECEGRVEPKPYKKEVLG